MTKFCLSCRKIVATNLKSIPQAHENTSLSEQLQPKSNSKIVEICKMDTPSTRIHAQSLKAQTSPLFQIHAVMQLFPKCQHSNTCITLFSLFCLRLVSFVPNVVIISGLSILDCLWIVHSGLSLDCPFWIFSGLSILDFTFGFYRTLIVKTTIPILWFMHNIFIFRETRSSYV